MPVNKNIYIYVYIYSTFTVAQKLLDLPSLDVKVIELFFSSTHGYSPCLYNGNVLDGFRHRLVDQFIHRFSWSGTSYNGRGLQRLPEAFYPQPCHPSQSYRCFPNRLRWYKSCLYASSSPIYITFCFHFHWEWMNDMTMFCLSGVIWKGDKLIDGVPETLDMLRSMVNCCLVSFVKADSHFGSIQK